MEKIMDWRCIKLASTPLHLAAMLAGGQSFRWKFDDSSKEWTGVFKKTVWKLKQVESLLQYKVLGSLDNIDLAKNDSDKEYNRFEGMLRKYLRLDEDIDALYKDWSSKDKLFATAAEKFAGIRMLAQEPVENLFSFICSSNNHISRISSMIENLCTTYGEKICKDKDMEYYSFPCVNNLCDKKVESKLRELSFGYRAKYIQKSAETIVDNGGEEWFETLTKLPYKEARQELMKLPGIGPKVADCICLMSLNHLEALPVDTHVYQIASKHYLPHLKAIKNVTDKIYNEIGDHFRQLYGSQAGWAHTVIL